MWRVLNNKQPKLPDQFPNPLHYRKQNTPQIRIKVEAVADAYMIDVRDKY